MILVKKSVLILSFLSFLIATILFAWPMFQNTNLIFSLNLQTFYSLITLSVLILATALAFAVLKALTFGLVLLLPASSLLSPTVKQVAGILILILSLVFYLSVSKQIAQKGFEIPDSLIESSLNMMPQQNLPSELIKPMITEQLQNIIKPYQNIIPAILALLLFLTLQSFVAILGIFLSPIIWLIFYILEKTNFIHFETEMREVKKLVV